VLRRPVSVMPYLAGVYRSIYGLLSH
jgi:hypothetical protein